MATKNLKNIIAQFRTILVDFIKFVHAILPKSKRMSRDYQLNTLNSIRENCLKA